MNTFELTLAFGPLAMYFVALGIINLGSRPVIVPGSRETVALALALVGFVLIGPMALFFPEAAANQFGPKVWLLLLAFYTLSVLLWTLVARPRLVIYNVDPAELRKLLAEVAIEVDPEAHWAGDNLVLPQRGVQLHVEDHARMRNVTLLAVGAEQSPSGWEALENALRRAARSRLTGRNPRGVGLLSSGLVMLAAIVYRTLENPQAIAEGILDLLSR